MSNETTVVVCLLTLLAPASGHAQSCVADPPHINKPGFRPHQAIAYAVAPSPGGAPFPDGQLACVWRAFQAWTEANRHSTLGVRFVPGPDGIVVRYDDRGGLLPHDAAGGWTRPVRAVDGGLLAAEILLSPNAAVLNHCDAVTKIVLHELGHLHGLADRFAGAGPSVMNDGIRKNDRGGRIPLQPTACDAAQARAASSTVGSSGVLARRDPSGGPVDVVERLIGLGPRPAGQK